MRKKILLFLLLCFFMEVKAEFVTSQQALQKAQEFVALKKHIQGFLQPLQLVSVPSEANNARGISKPAYYIFNYTDGKGFVIVSAESTTAQILAYSDKGSFHPECIDKGAEVFLDHYAKEIEKARVQGLSLEEQAYVSSMNARAESSDKVLLETACFSQEDGNWSNYTPVDGAPAGCVATAMAILMHYNQWPSVGKGSNSYTTRTLGLELSHDFSQDTYNWACIPKTPCSDGGWSSEAKEEIAKIQYSCGIACNMDYAPGSSGAYTSDGIVALVKNFGYSGNYSNSDSLSQTAMENCRNSINGNHPVYVAGYGNGNHAFIMDGYDQSYFHYNMGWGGYNNGWYANGAIASDYRFTLDAIYSDLKPQTGAIVDENSNDSISYQLYDDGTMNIEGHGTVPAYDFIPYSTEMKAIRINICEGITGLEDYLFANSRICESVSLPLTLKYIGRQIFEMSWNLQSIVIPDSVEYIAPRALSPCMSSLKVSENNKTFDSRDNCNAIIETATNILVRGCTNTVIPETVKELGESAFDYCKDITDIKIPESVTKIGKDAFYRCQGLKTINIPNSVKEIGNYAFGSCENLTSVTLGTGIENIGTSVFIYSTNLNRVVCNATKVPSITEYTFDKSVISSATLYVPNELLDDYKNADYWKEFGSIEGFGGGSSPSCATPTVSFEDGHLKFATETEGAEIVHTITALDATTHQGTDIQLSGTYVITAYARKRNLDNSPVARYSLTFKTVDAEYIDGAKQMPVRTIPVLTNLKSTEK